jgi:cell division septation protein DedD
MPNEPSEQRPKTRQMPLPSTAAPTAVPPTASQGVVQLDQVDQGAEARPPGQSAAAPTGQPDGNWHWFHYPIGIFLVAYGTAGVLLLAIAWGDRHEEMATYLSKTIGLGIATPALLAVKTVEILLTLLALAGLMRRRDVWYLPALFGWIGGFAVFCVLDLWSGRFGGLVEHVLYLLGFLLVLAVSFALGVKVRVARAEQGPIEPSEDRPSTTGMKLTRTQEMALAALNRWQRTTSSSTTGRSTTGRSV